MENPDIAIDGRRTDVVAANAIESIFNDTKNTNDSSTSPNTSSVINYINYYLLNSDVNRYFKSESYSIIFWAEVIAIVVSLAVFYLPIIQQMLAYYFFGPSLTPNDLEKMAIERSLLESYNNIKTKYQLVCTVSDTLGYKNLQTNQITEAKTLSGQVVTNCSNLVLT